MRERERSNLVWQYVQLNKVILDNEFSVFWERHTHAS